MSKGYQIETAKGLAGLDTAKGMGFTHTNPAKTSFDDEEQMISRKPKSVIKETK